MRALKKWLVCATLLGFLFSAQEAVAQKVLSGVILDAQSGERVPFASLRFSRSGNGRLSDAAGTFTFHLADWPRKDTLEISYVGFQTFDLPVSDSLTSRARRDTLFVIVHLQRGKYINEVVVSKKVDFGLLLWRKIVRRKKFNDRYRFDNFSYELYNKLELDLNKVNKNKLQDIKLLRPFDFVLNNIDSSEDNPFLPIYVTETLSDYYYERSPLKRREVIIGSKTVGLDNPSVSKFLGGMDQNIDFYKNFIPVFDKRFVSPLSNNGDDYYRYKIVDTEYVNSRRLIHLIFTPKRKGQSTFEGDCWVHDSSFAIQKMTLRLDASANVNYVDQLSLIQEFSLINDSTWFLYKDKFVINLSALGKNRLGVIGRKTTTYKNVVYNDSSVSRELDKNKILEEVVFGPNARNQPDSFWVDRRHEDLSRNEKAVYQMVDTLLKMKVFHDYANAINFIGTGYLDIGNYTIGPWYNWIYANALQGLRLRFDLSTNKGFNKDVTLHGYLAYGFADQRLHGEGDFLYLLNRSPRFTLFGMYRQDLDYGQQFYDEITSDNIFSLAVRKSGVPIKFLNLEEEKLEMFKEWRSGFSVTLTGDHKIYDPILNLPSKNIFSSSGGNPLNSLELAVKLRFAYLEQFFETSFYRTSLGSDYPIVDLTYTRGIPGLLGSTQQYSKLNASISDYIKIPPLGSIYYNVFAGKTYGTLPFPFLNVAPGNETYYYDQYSFSLMNKFEYLHDQYVGINYEHNIGNGLFRFIPLTRKLKFRQFYTIKALWGSLSDANALYNASPDYTFRSLDGKTYMEIGTGVDNILKVLRFDVVWRVLPKDIPTPSQERFGIFGSLRLTF
jgi:hypothetical protein